MIWHIVRFDLGSLEPDDRRDFEASLEALSDLDEVAWLRVARDIEEPQITGLLTGFADADALAAYRIEPRHAKVLARIRDLALLAWRLDVATDDDPAMLA